MKTKTRSDARFRVRVIGLDTALYERVRASLRGGPFHVTPSDPPIADDEPDLYIAHARDLDGIDGWRVPVIACGPPGLLRSAFLGGCVDYLREPWAPEELELRARAALGRAQRRFAFPWGTVSIEGLTLRTPRGVVTLSAQESKILRLLLRARGEPVPRAALACETWGSPGRASGRALDVHVASLRKKVRSVEVTAGRFIECIRGAGYMIP